MAKKVKNTWLGARADEDLETKVTAYIEKADMSMADLVRQGVIEYMHNHPIKADPKPDQTQVTKPGSEE